MTDRNGFNKNAEKAANNGPGNELGEMPTWQFKGFYPDIESPEFEADFAKIAKDIEFFVHENEGKVASHDAAQLTKAITQSKDIGALFGKLMTFVSMKAVQDSKKYGSLEAKIEGRASALYSKLQFFGHELKALDETTLETMMDSSPDLAHYRPYLANVRRGIPHTPSLDVSKYSGELDAESDWNRLFDERSVSRRFEFEGKTVGMEEILTVSAFDPDETRRKEANEAFVAAMSDDSSLSAAIHNSLMRLKSVYDRWTNFDKPWDARHFANNIEPEVVDALEDAVKGSYERISHRFYALKAKLMGKEQLEMWDRNVNVLAAPDADKIPFETAKDMVLDAYESFSPKMAKIARKFFDENWIDAPVGPNKRGGAFASPGAAKLAHPFVMLNYLGTPNDVATMAHELGHGVHQYLAAHKGDALVSTPLTMAETASVFGEMVTFQSLIDNAGSDDEKRALLFDKVSSMINTVMRQISFYDFEKRIHGSFAESGKPLSEEEFNQHWLDVMRESLGPSIKINDNDGPVYGYIPHFIHSPFYVYAYAFGDALVNALYRVYEEGTVPDFEEKYIEMLEKGGTLTFDDLNDMFGLDVRDPAFWEKGLSVIEDFLDQLEVLSEPLLEKQAKLAANKPPTPQP